MKKAEKVLKIKEIFEQTYPMADCSLEYTDRFSF